MRGLAVASQSNVNEQIPISFNLRQMISLYKTDMKWWMEDESNSLKIAPSFYSHAVISRVFVLKGIKFYKLVLMGFFSIVFQCL